MGMFSGWLDGIAGRQFGKDAGGRMAFFPRGWRRTGYYVEGSDENKVKGVIKIYLVASALINFTGSMAAIAFTQSIVFDERSTPLRKKLELGLAVYSISGLVLFIIPALLLWTTYKQLIKGFCSELATVEADSVGHFEHAPRQHTAAILLVLTGLLLLILGIIAAISYRP